MGFAVSVLGRLCARLKVGGRAHLLSRGRASFGCALLAAAGCLLVSPAPSMAAAQPTLSTGPSPAAVTLGTNLVTLTDSATLSGGSSPTGMLMFILVAPGGATLDTEFVTVSGDGTYTTPTGLTLSTSSKITGTYQWDASYLGDGSNNAVSDIDNPAEQAVVVPATPVVATSPSPTRLSSAGTLTDSATLSGYFPTGALTFTLHAPGGATVDTETVTVFGNGTYSTPIGFTASTSGTYQWDATYSGDTNNNPVSDNNDPNEQVVVGPTLSTRPSPAAVVLGTSPATVKDAATLSGGSSPTGSLTFTLRSPGGATVDTEIVVVSGNGTYATPTGFTLPTSSTVTGTYRWDVSYSGDTKNFPAADTGDAVEQVVVKAASPALKTTPSPTRVSLGVSPATLKDSATLSGGYFPTGALTFTLHGPGGATIDTETVTVRGDGAYTTPTGFTPSTSGTYQWDATYSGDGNNNSVSDNNDPNERLTAAPPGADLSIKTTGSPNPVVTGGRLIYRITIANNGPDNATGVIVIDRLPATVHFNSLVTSQGRCARSTRKKHSSRGGTVTCGLGRLSKGSTVVIKVIVRVTKPGTLRNTARVAGNQSDPNRANNLASTKTRCRRRAQRHVRR